MLNSTMEKSLGFDYRTVLQLTNCTLIDLSSNGICETFVSPKLFKLLIVRGIRLW